jgi:hypothetical protein
MVSLIGWSIKQCNATRKPSENVYVRILTLAKNENKSRNEQRQQQRTSQTGISFGPLDGELFLNRLGHEVARHQKV